MKVLIIHSCHLHRDFIIVSCAMVGVYVIDILQASGLQDIHEAVIQLKSELGAAEASN